MKRKTLWTFTFTIILCVLNTPAFAEDTMSDMEWDTDRQGSDYKEFNLPTSDPTLCQEACSRDPKCKSWAYVKPNTVKGPLPKCHLKDALPDAKINPACVCGRKLYYTP